GVPIADLFEAAGYPIEQNTEMQLTDDFHSSIENIQKILENSNMYDKKFSIKSVEQQLENYKQYAQTDEGKDTILKGFEEKLKKVGSIGPFINNLKEMFVKFSKMKGTPVQLALMGSALLYFILPVDVIPDYIFPIGYLDDAIALQLILGSLTVKG
ncbi:MAG: YkvA family protein, partial [Neobacillus sp.]